LDGLPVRACVTPLGAALGHEVTTVESLAGDVGLHPLQQAFVEEGAVQCGYCTAGMLLAAVALVRQRPRPDVAAIRTALAGNVCRCCAYLRIERAVARAAAALAGPPAASPTLDAPPAVAAFEGFRPRAPW